MFLALGLWSFLHDLTYEQELLDMPIAVYILFFLGSL